MNNENMNYLAAAKAGQKIIIDYWRDRLKELEMTIYSLSKKSGIAESTLRDYFNNGTNISLINYLRICGALDLRPYLLPAEMDDHEMNRIDLN